VSHKSYENTERTQAMVRPRNKGILFMAAATVIAGVVAAVAPVTRATRAQAQTAAKEGVVCTSNRNAAKAQSTFLLTAKTGTISTADGNSIFMWGFADGNNGNKFQHPGPVLCVQQGDTVTITLKNTLPQTTSIVFPGVEGVRANGKDAEPAFNATTNVLSSLTNEAGANGGSVTYSFIAGKPGTYLYESGTDPGLQVQMGLFGVIIVRPTPVDPTALATTLSGKLYGTATQDPSTAARAAADKPDIVYGDGSNADAIYSDNHEYLVLLSEIDPDLHAAVQQDGISTSTQYTKPYHAHYYLINGRTFPDTIAPNGAAWLPNQPYGALAHVEPYQLKDNVGEDSGHHANALAANPVPALIRYANVEPVTVAFHPHSNHEKVVQIDANPLDATQVGINQEHFAVVVNPGATQDATFTWTNVEDYADAANKRVPVPVPGERNLTEGDLWSGSPYLGNQQLLVAGINQNNACGEYYHVAHNHDLTQVTNYGATFGGMLTLIRVDPGEPSDSTKTNGCAE
jgi:FtsP/CotA-like multicopper oxidase with cupredoxin domain